MSDSADSPDGFISILTVTRFCIALVTRASFIIILSEVALLSYKFIAYSEYMCGPSFFVLDKQLLPVVLVENLEDKKVGWWI